MSDVGCQMSDNSDQRSDSRCEIEGTQDSELGTENASHAPCSSPLYTAPLVSVRQVGKRFPIQRATAASLKTAMVHLFRFRDRSLKKGEFWALRDLDLDVHPGEIFGVIGPNGSGKSTLLALLARVLRPTCGEIHTRGRICTLLEIGAGFHPELAGIENIYLHAALLGLRRHEIEERLDEIIEFSELREFLHLPLRTFSSGMVTRLGFSIAIHVEPSILLMDEILAVGDEHFNRKCYAKVEEFMASGDRCIVLVSHDLGAVERLCHRLLWLDGGRMASLGPPGQVLDAYRAWVQEQEGGGAAGAADHGRP